MINDIMSLIGGVIVAMLGHSFFGFLLGCAVFLMCVGLARYFIRASRR